MTNYEPAWSAEAAVGLSDHVSLGVEASRVQFDPANDVEFGAAVVWSPSGWLGGANFVAGYYHYPGASGADTVELSAYLPLSDGPTLAELELTVSPEIHGPGFYASAYSGLSVVHPVSGTPVSLVAAGGIEKIADTPVKLDWSLGLVAELGQGMALRCEYVDTYRAISMTPSRAAVMLSLEKRL